MKKCPSTTAAIFLLASMVAPSHAATVSAGYNDLILGFRAIEGQGQSDNLEINLGSISQFYNLAEGTELTLAALSSTDLSALYGSDWNTRADLFWAVAGTTGRTSAGPDGQLSKTLWATKPRLSISQQTDPWPRSSIFGQQNTASVIETMLIGAPGSLDGATSSENSSSAAIINASLAGSWTAQITKTTNVSFSYWNPTIENTTEIVQGSYAASDLYEMQPGSGDGTYLGTFELSDSGVLTFVVPGGSTSIPSILTTGFVDLQGGFRWREDIGYIYDGFFPFVWFYDAENWVYIFTENASEANGYYVFDFGRAQFGYTGLTYYPYYANLPLTDPATYTSLAEKPAN